MEREIQGFRSIGKARDTAVAVEIGADADVVDAHHVDGVFEVVDGIENRRLTVFAEESCVERRVRHTTLLGESAELVVGEVARMVAERTTIRVAADDGRRTDVQCIIKTLFGSVAEVNHDAVAVHLANHLFAESAHAVVRVATLGRVADVVVAVVAERDIGHATLCESLYVFEFVLERQTVFDGQNDGFAAFSLVFVEVGRRTGEAQILLVLLDDGFDLVENAVSVGTGRVSGGVRCHRRERLAHFRLRQIGRHNDSVHPALGHLVQIDENPLVALFEMDALREEHRRVAMGIERQDAMV